jgi:hypothetical protein
MSFKVALAALSCIALASVTSTAAAVDKAKFKLKFNSRGKFKIVQFTDIHLGEYDKKDAKS